MFFFWALGRNSEMIRQPERKSLALTETIHYEKHDDDKNIDFGPIYKYLQITITYLPPNKKCRRCTSESIKM